MAKRMGRPPAGPRGSKVEDLPRVTIRLESEIRDRAMAYAKEIGQPLWRIIQELLRNHLDQVQAASLPVVSDVKKAVASPTADVRQVLLTRQEIQALWPAIHWRARLEPADGDELKAYEALFQDATEHSERLFRIGLDRARQRPRGPTENPPWELTLADCRRLRRAAQQFLRTGQDRIERDLKEIRRTRSGLTPAEEAKHRKRIRKQTRAANGKLRAVLKMVPWR